MWWRQRMAKANSEISHWAEYDYVVINDDLEHDAGEYPDHPGGRAHEAGAPDRYRGVCQPV